MKVFLGGTCNNSKWREELMNGLMMDSFNPVVKDWTPAHQAEEIIQRKSCDFVVYTITPEMTGVYSIAEVVDDSNKQPEKTIFCVLNSYGGKKFDTAQLKSLDAVKKMIKQNGANVYNSLKDLREYLNGRYIIGVKYSEFK